MKFRLTIYTASGRMSTLEVPVLRDQVTDTLQRWMREHEGRTVAFALLCGSGAPGLTNVYGVALPRPTSTGGTRFMVRTISHLQLPLTSPSNATAND